MGGHNTGWRLGGLALAWIAGVALQLNERSLMAPAVYLAALGGGVLLIAAAWRWRRVFFLALLGVLALGWGSAGWRAGERLAQGLPDALEGADIQIVGVVSSLPQRSASGLRFRFDVEQASSHGRDVALPPLLVLGWYAGFHEDAVLSPMQQALGAGQRWRFTVRLRQPHGNLNPHGFDHELNLFEPGVRATGTVRDAPPPSLLERAAGHPVERARQHLRDAIDASVADRRAAGVLAALSVGDQSAIEREDWDLFRNTGVAHLVSVKRPRKHKRENPPWPSQTLPSRTHGLARLGRRRATALGARSIRSMTTSVGTTSSLIPASARPTSACRHSTVATSRQEVSASS
jgi:competence protein ComEC